MNNKDIFQRAAELKLRFKYGTGGGELTVEQLYSLSKPQLNDMYIVVNEELEKKSGSRGLLSSSDASKSLEVRKLELRRDIIKAVFESLEAKDEASKKASERRATVAQLKDILTQKKSEELLSKSPTEIEAMLKNLGEDSF